MCIYAYMHIDCIRIHYTCIYVCQQFQRFFLVCMHIFIYVYTYMHTYIHLYAYAGIYIYNIHTHICIYTCEKFYSTVCCSVLLCSQTSNKRLKCFKITASSFCIRPSVLFHPSVFYLPYLFFSILLFHPNFR